MLLPFLAQLTTAVVFLVGGVSAQNPMNMENSIKRDTSIPAQVITYDDMGFTPRMSPRSLFERQTLGCPKSTPVGCATTLTAVYCCPSGKSCYYDDGLWKCEEDVLSGLSKGQKIGIIVGVLVAFVIVCAIALALFCYCCRKGTQIITAASNNQQNYNPGGAYPPQPVMYGGPQPVYSPAPDYNIPLMEQPPAGGEKPYADQPQYHPQPGYDQYASGQQSYASPPPQPTQVSAPPYGQPQHHG